MYYLHFVLTNGLPAVMAICQFNGLPAVLAILSREKIDGTALAPVDASKTQVAAGLDGPEYGFYLHLNRFYPVLFVIVVLK